MDLVAGCRFGGIYSALCHERFDNRSNWKGILTVRVEIHSVDTPYEYRLPKGRVLFSLEQAELSYERFDGSMGPRVTRVNFERGDGVGVLLYADSTDEVVLVEQFRYPVYASSAEGPASMKGWLLEVVAGIKDDEGHIVAQRELMEETGYELTEPLEHLTTFYVSPGGTSERLELYLAHVRHVEGIERYSGLADESEDIRTHIVALPEALRMVGDGRIVDGKTIIALLMLRDRLAKAKRAG